MSDKTCKSCGGEGIVGVEVIVSVAECCNMPLNNGECCGNTVEGYEQEFEPAPCPECFEDEYNEL